MECFLEKFKYHCWILHKKLVFFGSLHSLYNCSRFYSNMVLYVTLQTQEKNEYTNIVMPGVILW